MLQSFTQWINENSRYSIEGQLADLEQLYSLGMIEADDLVRDKIKLQALNGTLTALTSAEVTLLDLDLAEEIEEWVKDEALDFLYEFESNEEEKAFDEYITEAFNAELDWRVYLNGTIDVSMYYPDLGPEQRISWEDSEGASRSRDILDYYKEPIMRKLNPRETTGRLRLSGYITKPVQAMFSSLTNK